MYNYTLNLAQNMITSLMLCFKSAFRIRFRMDLVFFADPDPKLKTRIRICPLTNQWDLNDVVDQVFDFPDRIRIFGRSGSGLRKKVWSGSGKKPDPKHCNILAEPRKVCIQIRVKTNRLTYLTCVLLDSLQAVASTSNRSISLNRITGLVNYFSQWG